MLQSRIVCRAVLLLLLQASVCLSLLSQCPGKELLSPRVGLCCRAAPTASRCRCFAALPSSPHSWVLTLGPLSVSFCRLVHSQDRVAVGNWSGAVELGKQSSTGSSSCGSETGVSEGNDK